MGSYKHFKFEGICVNINACDCIILQIAEVIRDVFICLFLFAGGWGGGAARVTARLAARVTARVTARLVA